VALRDHNRVHTGEKPYSVTVWNNSSIVKDIPV